jgi:hypothetical protein
VHRGHEPRVERDRGVELTVRLVGPSLLGGLHRAHEVLERFDARRLEISKAEARALRIHGREHARSCFVGKGRDVAARERVVAEQTPGGDIADRQVENDCAIVSADRAADHDRRPEPAGEVAEIAATGVRSSSRASPAEQGANLSGRDDLDIGAPRELGQHHLRQPFGEPCGR